MDIKVRYLNLEKKIIEYYSAVQLNNALMNDKQKEAKDILLDSYWTEEGLVKKEVLNWYYPSLKSNLNEKRNTLGTSENDKQAHQTVERVGELKTEIVVDVNESNGSATGHLERPENLQQWPLSGEEIKVRSNRYRWNIDSLIRYISEGPACR